MKTLIIQTSPYHTASTLLVNALYGIIPELSKKNVIGIWNNFHNIVQKIIVIKSHNINIDELIKKYETKYKLIFICSERKEMNLVIDEKYRNYNNVIIFDYDELNETKDNSLIQIVDNIYNKLTNLDVFADLQLNKELCIERIHNMNNRYEEIKTKPFSYIDSFFLLHVSHSNRKK